jgi:hypothetical protein
MKSGFLEKINTHSTLEVAFATTSTYRSASQRDRYANPVTLSQQQPYTHVLKITLAHCPNNNPVVNITTQEWQRTLSRTTAILFLLIKRKRVLPA